MRELCGRLGHYPWYRLCYDACPEVDVPYDPNDEDREEMVDDVVGKADGEDEEFEDIGDIDDDDREGDEVEES